MYSGPLHTSGLREGTFAFDAENAVELHNNLRTADIAGACKTLREYALGSTTETLRLEYLQR